MKKLSLLSVLLLASLAAQAYVPLVREGVKWVYRFYNSFYIEGELEGTGDFAYFYQFEGDSVIDGLSYKKLYCSLNHDMDTKKMCPVAFLREVDKQVFALPCEKSHPEFNGTNFYPNIQVYGECPPIENLICDFGDINVTKNQYGWFFFDDSPIIEDETTFNGEKVNRYRIAYDDYCFVEGVGPDGINGRGLMGYGDMLEPIPINNFLVGVGPIKEGLVAIEDLDGNVLYKGVCHYEPGGYANFNKVDVSHVNQLIDALLGKSQQYLKYHDVNGDYKVDIADVNALIDIILGK